MKMTDDLSSAIRGLGNKEKDKLLLRLIRKDKVLIEQLHFQLVEGGETTVERRRLTQDVLEDLMDTPSFPLSNLLRNLREANRRIQHHVKITKDAYGEVALYMEFLSLLLAYHGQVCRNKSFAHRKLTTWIDHRIPWLEKKYAKLEEDFQLDFATTWLEIQSNYPLK